MDETPKTAWERSPAELVERFGVVMERYPQLERRKMFGYPAAFLGGHMVTGLFGSGWFVRLPEDGCEALLATGGAPFSPMPGRPMKGYALLPDATVEDDETLDAWLTRSIDHVASLPPKTAKVARKKRG